MSATPVPLPSIVLFNQNTIYTWSTAQKFNGFVLIGLVDPSDGVTPWSATAYGNLYPSLPLPTWSRVPIVNGVLNNSCGLFPNDQITPPGSAYIAYFYDATGRQIAGPSVTFTVAVGAATVTIPTPTLTAPSTLGPSPTPDS